MKKKILVFGEVCREIVLNGEVTDSGENITSQSFSNNPGGAGTDLSAAFAVLGYDTVLCSVVGNDADGRSLIKYLSSLTFPEGTLDAKSIDRKDGLQTPLHVSVNSRNGIKNILCRSADYGIGKRDAEDAFMCYPDITVVTGSVTSEGCFEISKQASLRKSKIYVLGCESTERLSKIGSCEVLSLNEEQAKRLTSTDFIDQQNCMKACMALGKVIKSSYIILRMSGGYFIYDGTYYTFQPMFDVPGIGDTDCDNIFCALFIKAFEESEGDLNFSCTYANVGVALYATHGKESIPTDEQIGAFARRNGVKL